MQEFDKRVEAYDFSGYLEVLNEPDTQDSK